MSFLQSSQCVLDIEKFMGRPQKAGEQKSYIMAMMIFCINTSTTPTVSYIHSTDRLCYATSCLSVCLPKLNTKLLHQPLPDPLMEIVGLLVRQSLLQAPIVDSVAHALSACLGMSELVLQLDILHHITSNITHHLHQVILVEIVGIGHGRVSARRGRRPQPKGHVLPAGRILGEGNEPLQLVKVILHAGKLAQETLVLGPEQTDVGDLEQEHGDALETDAERPAELLRLVGIDEQLLLADTAAQHLKPVALVVHLHLPRRRCERKVGLNPTDAQRLIDVVGIQTSGGLLGTGEDLDDHELERALEVSGDGLGLLGGMVLALQRVALRVVRRVGVLDFHVVRGQLGQVGVDGGHNVAVGNLGAVPHAGALHLVEDGVVAAVDLVAAVDVGADQVAVRGAGAEELGLVG